MNHHLLTRRRALSALALPAVMPLLAHGGPRSCYRTAGVPDSKPSGLTLALIDTTTSKDLQVLASFSSLVWKAMQKPNERLLVASFAALAPGHFPDVKADVLHESRPTAEMVESHVLDWTQRLHGCLTKLDRQNAESVKTAIKHSIATQTAAPFSEIVAAVRWAMLDLLPKLHPTATQLPVKLLVYSDGDLNSKTGTSFYRNGLPREISAVDELKAFKRTEGSEGARDGRIVDVWWVGIGLQPPGVNVYMTPHALEERRRFWTGVLATFGARHVQVGLTLPNDGM